MTKLPINFLLYTTAVGLVAGSGWLFYKATFGADKVRDNPAIQKAFKEHDDAGRASKSDDRQDDYNGDWWLGFRDVNVVGKLPPKPEEESTGPVEEAPVVKTEISLSDILRVDCVVLGTPEDTRIVVSYLPEANVTPPDDGFGTPHSGPADLVAGGALPGDPNAPLRQHLTIEDTLWAPYGHIRLVRIAPDAESVFFKHEDPAKKPEEAKEEEVFKAVAQLDQKVIAELLKDRRDREKNQGSGATKPPAAQTSKWQDVPQSREIAPREWAISRKDNDYIRDNTSRLLEDTGIKVYSGRRHSGLMFTRVPKRLAQLGVQAGDVILSVNKVPVKTKAQAIKVGKDQYKKGVRTFNVEILSRGRLETRTIHAPD